MKTAYNLQAVLSLLCLKKELDPLSVKKNSTQYSFLQKTHHHPSQPSQNHKEFWRWEVKTFKWLLKTFTAWSHFNDF